MATVAHPYKIGKNYFVQTVTHYYTGKLVKVFPGELVLSAAAWIADTGRLTQALEKGVFDEVELVGDIIISRGAIVTAAVFPHDLPTAQK